jgi:hypothetical protein
VEKEQSIENKCIRLQRLIEMFQRQADSYILHHEAIDDIYISSPADFSQFDHVDSMDDAQLVVPTIPSHFPVSSDDSEADEMNTEDLPILLPSSLGWEWCEKNGAQRLAEKEAKLRHAQANDAIYSMRLALGYKSTLFRTKVRPAKSQRTKTRAWSDVHTTDDTVHKHARNYSMARDAYSRLKLALPGGDELPELQLADLRINTAILGAAEVGQRNTQLPWIWSFGTAVEQDGTSMDECEY